MKRLRLDRGAVAVEFALVLVPLLLILMGVIDFGRAYTQKLTLADAARVGVRVIAVQNDSVKARDAILAVTIPAGMIDALYISPLPACPTGVPVLAPITVTVTYPFRSMTGMFNLGGDLTGKAVMRCGG